MDISQLRAYHPAQSNRPLPHQAHLPGYQPQPPLPRIPCEKEQFLCLLAALPALRKVPGIPPLKEGDPAAFITRPPGPPPPPAGNGRPPHPARPPPMPIPAATTSGPSPTSPTASPS